MATGFYSHSKTSIFRDHSKNTLPPSAAGSLTRSRPFPEIWKGFEMLDGLWSRSLDNLAPTHDQKRILPVLLFFNAHARIRIAFELGFSRCFPEALGTLRSAIESAAYGYQFSSHPYEFPKRTSPSVPGGTANIDQERNKLTRQIKSAFNKTGKNLFEPERDLGQLKKLWQKCSERGSHLTFPALSLRAMRQLGNGDATGRRLIFLYSDAPRPAAQALLTLFLDCGYAMHVVLYKSFESRLKLDPDLPRLCGEFLQVRGKVVQQLQASASNKP